MWNGPWEIEFQDNIYFCHVKWELHSFGCVTDFLVVRNKYTGTLSVMDWPLQIIDLNVTETVWDLNKQQS